MMKNLSKILLSMSVVLSMTSSPLWAPPTERGEAESRLVCVSMAVAQVPTPQEWYDHGYRQMNNKQYAQAEESFIRSGLPEAKSVRAWLYIKGCLALHLRTQAERDAIAIHLLREAGTPKATANLGRMYMEGRAGLELPSQAARDKEAVKLLLKSGTKDALSDFYWMCQHNRANSVSVSKGCVIL